MKNNWIMYLCITIIFRTYYGLFMFDFILFCKNLKRNDKKFGLNKINLLNYF